MEMKAVIDRFEGKKAVLLVGEQEISVVWPRELLPKCEEGDILAIQMAVDRVATEQARAEIDDLFEQIMQQNTEPDSK
ncbi:DUF3006 domain-containing protein [Sporomusa sphaeroides]|uniref:DUF3006 domain-containing protein n=2 Tax=Sporomusa TaxID=2375 RepID=A0ABM9W898_9FIRM|nr:DUF3006 domain-containing protein [Sporomusa sphaeroides]OLS57659.1 hypothetical protein SPSPH_11750 [Sporomusa sphaeroides DSM 2875]CVK21316.1 hypothetical protein SSPH_04003 [Sporomusa sphaeroides DSM 2875]SCM80975.1 conserved hypothetical protein [uncultured Sporomusa sp.]